MLADLKKGLLFGLRSISLDGFHQITPTPPTVALLWWKPSRFVGGALDLNLGFYLSKWIYDIDICDVRQRWF